MEKPFDWNQKVWVYVTRYVTLGKPFDCCEACGKDQ